MSDSNFFYASEWLFDGYTFRNNMLLHVTADGEIASLTEKPDVLPENTQRLEGVVMPGLINAHCHIELSHMLDQIPAKIGLGAFLRQITLYRQPIEEQRIMDAAQEAIATMAQWGVVAVGDICNTALLANITEPLPLHIHHFVEVFGLHESQSLDRFAEALGLFDLLTKHRSASMVLHAPYSVSPSLIKLVADFNRNNISTIHHQESAEEHELFLHQRGDFLQLFERVKFNPADFYFSGKRSSESVLAWNQTAKSLILVHNTFSEMADIQAAEEQAVPVYWCLCPKANVYIENTLPNVPMLMQANQKIVLGTDSLASNNNLNLWEEMNVLQSHYPQLTLSDLFTWATRNGAEALNRLSDLGTLEQGKKPGILWLPHIKDIHLPLPNKMDVSVLHGVTSVSHSA
jgi:cytosine/adenosine deaminase-related metal-dependent hydrolase